MHDLSPGLVEVRFQQCHETRTSLVFGMKKVLLFVRVSSQIVQFIGIGFNEVDQLPIILHHCRRWHAPVREMPKEGAIRKRLPLESRQETHSILMNLGLSIETREFQKCRKEV